MALATLLADFTTTYIYDVASRLAGVSMGVQSRAFVYDGRGLLLSETYPEKGISGGGTVTYSDYDARGHAGTITDGGEALLYTHDPAERLTRITKSGGALYKELEYSYRNDNSKDQLLRATRVNYLDWDGTGGSTRVTEEYRYDGVDGRISRRDTWIEKTNGPTYQQFRQEWLYDNLGQVTDIVYPCLAEGLTSFNEQTQLSDPNDAILLTNFTCAVDDLAPSRTQGHTYTDGFLTAVPGWATSISYHDPSHTPRKSNRKKGSQRPSSTPRSSNEL